MVVNPLRCHLASRLILVGLAVLGSSLIPARAQQSGESGPLPAGLITPRESASGKRFFWCAGVSKPAELDAYVAAGFDTLVVPLAWVTDDGGNEPDFSSEHALAAEGAKRKLNIIFALPAWPSNLGEAHVSADSPSYQAVWTTWAQGAVASLQKTPNLVGWMLPDDSRAIVAFDDRGFRRYLQEHFASIEALNARWNTGFADFDAIGTDEVAAIMAARRTPDTHSAASSGSDALPPLASPPTAVKPPEAVGFHPASLFLADWKRNGWRDLMTLWASTVRGADARHIVFSGACPDYAQLLAMPDGVDVSVSSVAPSVVENDLASGNPQALDIARHGGTRAAIARFSLAGNDALPPEALAQVVPRWMDAAIAHGSRGVAFSGFGVLNQNPVLLKAVKQTLKRLKNERDDVDAPLATFAVLLEPLAEGASPQIGDVPAPRGLYGFGEGLVEGEPSNLVASLRWGTAFGGADFLTPDDLSRVELGRYSTILAPQLLDCPPDTAQKLGEYVRGGGVLVADLGLGALQNGGSMAALPPSMAMLAGGIGPFEVQNATFNLRGATAHPLLPTWAKLLAARPGMTLSSGDGYDETAFDGPTGFAPPPPNAAILATGSSDGRNRAALSFASAGRGFFAFAPFRLWINWRPGQNGFDAFSGDLFSRGANLAVPTNALVPFPVGTRLGSTRFPEIINRPASVTLLNHNANSQGAQNVMLDTTGTGDWLWSNAFVHLSNSSETTPGETRPAPVEVPDDLEKRARPLSLYAVVRPGERLVCRQRSIGVQNREGAGITAQIGSESAASLVVNVWGEIIQVAAPVGGSGWQPIVPDGSTPFRMVVVDSPEGYRCPPGSRHRVTIKEVGVPDDLAKKGATSTQLVMADAGGRLRFDFSGGACNVQIAPDLPHR